MRRFALILLIPLALSAQPTAAGRGGNPQAAGSAGRQAPPPPPPTPTADLASVEGQVFNAVGGTPLRKANITLNRANGGPLPSGARTNYSATTDASGRYSVSGIEPGTYRFNATHTGFLNMQYNARRPGGQGTSLDIGRAERKTGVDFRLTPHGVITGKVTDEDGDPIENVQIQVMRVTYNQGKKQLQQNNGAQTNDLGEYRISGVEPGKVYLCAIYRDRRMMDGMIGAGVIGINEIPAQEDYVTTYFPGVTDLSAASPLDLGAGDQAQGVNFRLTKVHTVRVSGRVTDTTSPPAPEPAGRGGTPGVVTGPDGQVVNIAMPMQINPRIQLRLQPRNAMNQNGMMMTNVVVKADGTFEFASVAPGPYNLIATNNQGGRGGARGAKQAIDVGNSNMEGINIAITPGATVTGHVRYDGDPPSPLPSLTVRLTSREPTAGLPAPAPAKVGDDGTFTFENVNLDLYTVNINTPQSLYLKSLRSGTTDVMVSGVDLTNGAASLDILMGMNPPQVGGTVMNAATSQPAAAVTVVLIPRDKDRQGQNYFYPSSTTDQYGNFTLSRVTPGDYDVYAWEDVQYGQWFDSEWMKAYTGKGESVTAAEGSPANVKLTMIPAK